MNRLLTVTKQKNHGYRPETVIKAEPPSKLLRMYSDFCSQWKTDCGPFSAPMLNVVLAFEDFQAGVHGFHTCRDLFEAVDQELSFGFRNAWKFDFLRNARLREKAIGEAICADMVVIAAHAPGSLPPAAKWWLETTLEQREGDPGALVLLLDEVPEDAGAGALPIEAYLAECARNSGMELFIKRAASRRRSGLGGTGVNRNETDLSELLAGLGMKTGGHLAVVNDEPRHWQTGSDKCARNLQRGRFGLAAVRTRTR
jgi:hypothetical protein